ncbi:MAG TPA: hypothetical protein VLE95_01410 [Chlamydiales bacterium]|nr:hypothetical protein [Chlamydiales bacterium]
MAESAASALQHLFCLRTRLAIRQWSLAPEQKICAASLHISANLILNHYTIRKLWVYTQNNSRIPKIDAA